MKRFHDFRDAVAVQVAVVNPQRLREGGLVLGVPAPVAGHQVHPSVAIEIARGDAVPPTGRSQAKVPRTEFAFLVVEYL